MRTGGFIALLSLFLVPSVAWSSQEEKKCNCYGCYDCYDPRMVRSWVELPLGAGVGISHIEKHANRGGDQVANGIIRGFSEEELLDPKRLDTILAFLRLSYSEPKLIVCPDSRLPKATMVLLHYLKHEVSDPEAQKKIIETEQYVSKQMEELPPWIVSLTVIHDGRKQPPPGQITLTSSQQTVQITVRDGKFEVPRDFVAAQAVTLETDVGASHIRITDLPGVEFTQQDWTLRLAERFDEDYYDWPDPEETRIPSTCMLEFGSDRETSGARRVTYCRTKRE